LAQPNRAQPPVIADLGTAATVAPGQVVVSPPPALAPTPPIVRPSAENVAPPPTFLGASATPQSTSSTPAPVAVPTPQALMGPAAMHGIAATATPTEDQVKAKTLYFGNMQPEPAHPRLVVIRGGNADGLTYTLNRPTQDIGRTSGEITFQSDVFLGSPHATFLVRDGKVIVVDCGTANGVFLRIKQPVLLAQGDMFLVGEQLLQLDLTPLPDYAPDMNGTYFYGSPRPDSAFRVVQLLAGGGEGALEHAIGTCMTIGREGNHFDFPRDRFISGQHARLDLDPSGYKTVLRDLGSRNGTFVRINGSMELSHGDYLFLGQQLLRVELN
jgi:pSer/pThr/pTyr-binding forkhead associated (FHA) protein